MEIVLTRADKRDTEAISLEEWERRRILRRRRVAKRLTLMCPVFVVQEMQDEFPGYTWDQYVEDMKPRRRRKKKSKRHIKQWRFDWNLLYEEVPEFVNKCVVRTPTKAVIRMKIKEVLYRVTINSKYTKDQHTTKLETLTLIRLIQGTVKGLLTHPAVQVQEEKPVFTTTTTTT